MTNLENSPLELREKQDFLMEAARHDLLTFCQVTKHGYESTWFHEIIAYKLEDALARAMRGEKVRIILTIPPRHGKSELASIRFPAFAIGKYPNIEFILSTYGADLSETMGMKTRDVISGEAYQAIFPGVELRADQKSKAKWMTNKGGTFTAVGIGGAVTGIGAKVILIDDAHKSREEAESATIRETVWQYYRDTLYSRLEGFGAIIIIMQRWHCFSRKQLIQTENGMEEIQDVRVGDKVLTPKGFQTVNHVMSNPIGDKKMLQLIILIDTANDVLEVTSDHLIKTKK